MSSTTRDLCVLTEEQIKEDLSIAFVHAIAANIGCQLEIPKRDKDSVDAVFTMKVQDPKASTELGEIKVQLKATAVTKLPESGTFKFPLRAKNFNDLCKNSTVPRLLIVLVLPEQRTRWLEIKADGLILRRRAFWYNLLGETPTPNTSTKTIHIPVANVFDCDTAQRLLIAAARQERLQ